MSAKTIRLPRNKKQTYQLNSRHQMWWSGLTLAMSLTLNFQGQIWNLLYLSQKWSDCHVAKKEKKKKYWLDSRLQMWPSGLTLAMTLILRFQGQIWNLLYLSQKLFNCHEMKNEHINWTLGLKCSQHFWPWSWPWPWIFKVNFKIAVLQKWQGWLTLSLIHNHDGDLWWPRWGVRFYRIVTGVTSDAGVPSTHLVLIGLISRWLKLFLKNSSNCIQLPLAQTWKKSIFLNKTFYIYSSFIQFYTYVFIWDLHSEWV